MDRRWDVAVAKAEMLNRRPVVPGRAVAKGRLVVVSKVAELAGKVSAAMALVGKPKAEVTGDPCKVAR